MTDLQTQPLQRIERRPRPFKKVLRSAEAADYLNVSESLLAKRRLRGLPPAYVSLGGRAVGYLLEDLNDWLRSCRRHPASESTA